MTENETLRYIDKLSELVNTYNKRPHSTLKGISPNTADLPENEIRIRGILRSKYYKVKKEKNVNFFRLGDIVRIKKLTPKISKEGRAYANQYHNEYFVITKIDHTQPRISYHIKSMNTQEEILGSFYKNELSHCRGSVFKIEKILKTVGVGKNKKHLVRWLYFSPEWDSWIKDSDIVSAYK